jgi:tetratricopeptide (TPR) repeat protein
MTSALPVRWITAGCAVWSVLASDAADIQPTLLNKPWFEARSIHFHTFSCGPVQQVARLTARLEQFRVAYEALAGAQAVLSPPINVIALPDQEALARCVPLYQGKPGNLSGFFHRGSDENLIVLSLSDGGTDSLETIFHEYAHLLLRRNQEAWPMWLNEGMADIYATFEVTGDHGVRLGKPQALYLDILAHEPLLPLATLFAITHDSPGYNERERQGIFYAESWLLTHYLMVGSPVHRARFGELTTLLRQGQAPEQAFTNTFRLSLPLMQKELNRYIQQGRFNALELTVRASLQTTQPLATRALAPAETCFRLGDELFRVGRDDEARQLFTRSGTLDPASPLSYEGLGLMAAEAGQHAEALDQLKHAVAHGSKSFLVHYLYAREKLVLSTSIPDTYSKLKGPDAAEVQTALETSLALMPEFGPAHHLMGFFQLVQEQDLAAAERHLKRAIELEPEKPAYLLTLAQIQIAAHEPGSARGTLTALCQPYIDGKVRAHAQKLLQNLGSPTR